MQVRSTLDSKIAPAQLEAEAHRGELVLGGGTAFASASNPSAEVIDGTGVSAGASNGCTLSATDGTVTIARAGLYLVELELQDFSCGAASGNVQFTGDYAPDGTTYAAFGATAATGGGGRMQAIRLALTTKESIRLSRVQSLKVGSKVRFTVTSAAGGAITVTEGSLRLTQLSDASPATPT
jgi:hypothetical protein